MKSSGFVIIVLAAFVMGADVTAQVAQPQAGGPPQAPGGGGGGNRGPSPAPAFVANPNGTVIRSAKQPFRIELVADGLMTPWALAFLPDGRLLVATAARRAALPVVLHWVEVVVVVRVVRAETEVVHRPFED